MPVTIWASHLRWVGSGWLALREQAGTGAGSALREGHHPSLAGPDPRNTVLSTMTAPAAFRVPDAI